MKKTHAVVIAIVLLLMVSLAFAQQGQKTYVSGQVSAANTPGGVVVEGDQVSYTVPVGTAHQARPAAHHAKMNRQAAAAAKATQAQNTASLKKGEPALRVNKTTTETDAYEVTVHNKKGTTDYGVVEQTVTNPQGRQTTEGVVYSAYASSKMARANAKRMEVSVAAGQTISYNKDNRDDRYATNGLAAGVSVLHDMSNHLALGVDYMMLHPRAKTHENGAEQRHYHAMYAHNMALAGKLTVNPWDSLQIYLPMGVGMMNARMKTDSAAANASENHWGASLYGGVGVQYEITPCLFAGLEYRYTYGFIHDKHLTPFYKDRDLQFHTVMMRIGMRF